MTRPSLAELDLTSPSALLDQVCVSCPADRASSEEGSLLQDCFAINDGIQIVCLSAQFFLGAFDK